MRGVADRRGPTIKDIAARLEINHSTVSRALNDHPHVSKATKTRVANAAAQIGYVANSGARLMRSGASRMVGLLVPDIQNEFYSVAARVMAETCAGEGYQLLLAISEDDPDKECREVQALREARVAGVVITPTANPRRDTVRQLSQLSTLQFLRQHRSVAGDAVGANDARGLFMATEHLIALGHIRIGYIGVTEELSTGRSRADGYRESIVSGGLGCDPALLRLGAPKPAFGRAALNCLLALPNPPSAVVVGSPRLMLGMLEEVVSRRLCVPRDLSIVAYSDSDWFRAWNPQITAVALPVAAMARTAASLLFHKIRHPTKDGPCAVAPFEPVLCIRSSTTPRIGAAAAVREVVR